MKYEDKQMVAEYMGWVYHETDDKKWWNIIGKDGATHLLDLNDAGLCVKKMVENGDWIEFYQCLEDTWFLHHRLTQYDDYYFGQWIFNPDNFFSAMAAWRKQFKNVTKSEPQVKKWVKK